MEDRLNYFLDPNFRFDEASHTYTYVDPQTKKPVQIFKSVTGFLSQFKEKFDSERIAKMVAKKQGKTVASVLNEWKKISDTALDLGTLVHKWIEDYYNGSNPAEPEHTEVLARVNQFRAIHEERLHKLVPIKQELQVLDAYLFLQKIRYGSQLCIHTKIGADLLGLCVPPLTLQLTVENVLKHNTISNESVLDIWIEAKGGELIITNTYQCKTALEESTGIGQKNILEKYRLLGERLPMFYLENGNYVVRLPLLNAE